VVSGLLAVFVLLAGCGSSIRPLPAARHTQTNWVVRDSEAFEAIAFLNALTGDPLARPHYLADLRHFEPLITAEVKDALATLADFRDHTLHAHLSGFMMAFFLAGKAKTLDDLIALTAGPESIRQALKDYDRSLVEINIYYGDQGWKMFEETLPSLQTVFSFLREAGFADYWRAGHLDQIRQECARIQSAVRDRNIVPIIEAHLGFGLPSDQVTIYLVHYLWPYGHHLIGTSLATVPEDSDSGVVRTTVHELLHNPFNNTDPAFWEAANSLKEDPFLSEAFGARDPKYGYNNWPDYVAEDSVRALEQRIEEGLGLGPRWNWTEDGGMHVLARVLYALMEKQGFPQNGESYQDFIRRTVAEGTLAPGRAESLCCGGTRGRGPQ
jgi:hypothetical protein